MRLGIILLLSTSLAACGGAGVQSVGSNAPASAGGTTPVTGGTGSTTTTSAHSFLNPTEVKTYSAIGGVHRYSYTTNDIDGDPTTPGIQPISNQYQQTYAGDSSTARDSAITVTYNPRDAIFDLTIAAAKANVGNTIRFQDPAHRTDFGGAREPQGGVPDLTALGVNFLQVGSETGTTRYDPAQSNTFPVGDDAGSVDFSTFFFQRPGTTTKFVTFAGFVRNATSVSQVTPTGGGTPYLEQRNILERAAFVFGERTQNSAVPRTGTGSYVGPMIATLVFNPLLDTNSRAPTYFQWISGTANTSVDFAASTFNIALAGNVSAPTFDVFTSREFALPGGSTFSATGAGQVNLVNAGGFLGQISAASFTRPDGVVLGVNIAGSSVDGAFYGPAGEEVGGGFRIVGGNPDERIDILGAFTGKK
jgi:C-lobe and N-lobe beta barrels of Tf-binding protein B